MSATNVDAIKAVKAICDAVLCGLELAGESGIPAGHLYARLMEHGATLEQFQSFMRGMVQAGLVSVTLAGQVYRITDAGRKAIGAA